MHKVLPEIEIGEACLQFHQIGPIHPICPIIAHQFGQELRQIWCIFTNSIIKEIRAKINTPLTRTDDSQSWLQELYEKGIFNHKEWQKRLFQSVPANQNINM